ncbi:MAG: hypothetical protein ACQBVK_01865, partial [Candidatus Phytoplasma sp. TWB_XP]
SEFLEDKKYYQNQSQKYNMKNGWSIINSPSLIVPNVFKLWADIVRDNLPNLKNLILVVKIYNYFIKIN